MHLWRKDFVEDLGTIVGARLKTFSVDLKIGTNLRIRENALRDQRENLLHRPAKCVSLASCDMRERDEAIVSLDDVL